MERKGIDRRTFVKLGMAGAGAVSLSAVSERSVAAGGAPMAFPDFTRGKWRDYPKLEIVEA